MSQSIEQLLEHISSQLSETEARMSVLITTKDIVNDPEAEKEFDALSERIRCLTGELESVISTM